MIKAIITDIEGTITDISFVQHTLFPYAKARLAAFVSTHQHDAAIVAALNEMRVVLAQPNATLNSLIAQLLAWIDEDNKATPLKTIQGLIWQQGYHQGDFKGQLYPDAYLNLVKMV